jgi:hypothetical protein
MASPASRRHGAAAKCSRMLAFRLGSSLIAAVILSSCSRPPDTGPRAHEDALALLGAVSVAEAYVFGEIGRVARIDRTGYRAHLAVRAVISGAVRAGDQIEIAWEELATQRAPRFAKGDVVVLALAPLPSSTLWLHRFPPQLRNNKVFLVAANGDAFLRGADPNRIAPLRAWVVLPPSERAGSAGARALARVVAGGEERLALAAAQILRGSYSADKLEDPDVVAALTGAMRHHQNAEVLEAILGLLENRPVPALRPIVLELAARDHEPLKLAAWRVLARWADPAAREQLAAWAASSDPRWRVLAAEASAVAGKYQWLDSLSTDAAPEVRLRVAGSSTQPDDAEAIPRLAKLLGDADANVRRTAARSLAQQGTQAMTVLQDALNSNDPNRAAAAVLALAEMGEQGKALLLRASAEHPEESVRKLAQLAIGQPQHEH